MIPMSSSAPAKPDPTPARKPKARSPGIMLGVFQVGAILMIVGAATYASALIWYGLI